MRELEVIHSKLSSASSSERCVGSFENHTRGIGSKLMFKMGYEVKGLGKNAQGIIEPILVEEEPILVEEQPKNFGLGYVKSNGKDSKAMKACEKTSRTFVPSSKSQTFQVFFQFYFHFFKPLL